jgi:hypothetical protein
LTEDTPKDQKPVHGQQNDQVLTSDSQSWE